MFVFDIMLTTQRASFLQTMYTKISSFCYYFLNAVQLPVNVEIFQDLSKKAALILHFMAVIFKDVIVLIVSRSNLLIDSR